MELIDAIKQIAKVYTDRKDVIQTEEATKNALIMPFISALGYNVFDPSEVVPLIYRFQFPPVYDERITP